ncbi:MAG TPA: peptide ABC transporter ATP-binding protein [Candidatus Aquiluna sp.]|jgi:oligopeptide/dipeptide ABC transporter ATP-binding protein|nr:peptide ABC transporter ATP-binding protein [Aquiluna sp.]
MNVSTGSNSGHILNTDAVVTLNDVKVHYPVKEGALQRVTGHVKAVDGVDLSIARGKTLGLVGESGCGKTTLGRVIAALVAPTGGDIWMDLSAQQQLDVNRLRDLSESEMSTTDRDLWKQLTLNNRLGSMSKEKQRQFRRNCQVVFQDAFSSLNPRQLVRDIVGRPLRVHEQLSGEELDRRVIELLEKVGLGAEHLLRFPHQFSGGQRQRISIARALALNPEFVILDEPTSALDVSVQAQILNLLVELQAEMGLTYLFITHDLGVVQHMADDIAVMYLGQIVEYGPTDQVFDNPLHPYSRVLRDSNPTLEGERNRDWELSGTVPNPIDPPHGCRLHPRCPVAAAACGWSVSDALSRTEENSPVLFETIKTIERVDDFNAQVAFDNEDGARAFVDQLTNSSMNNAMPIPPTVSGSSVTLAFNEVKDASLEQIQKDRWSSCIRSQENGLLPELVKTPQVNEKEGQ